MMYVIVVAAAQKANILLIQPFHLQGYAVIMKISFSSLVVLKWGFFFVENKK